MADAVKGPGGAPKFVAFPITTSDYLMGRDKLEEPGDERRDNMHRLIGAVNLLLAAYIEDTGNSFHGVTSGYRPAAINARVKNAATKSAHLSCEAVDLADADHKLSKWILAHLPVLETLGLYLEHPSYTPTWVHVQTRATKSGKRVFIP